MLGWADSARDDLLNIHQFIQQDNPAAALRVALNIMEKAQILDDHPKIGRVGVIEGTREWVITNLPFTLIYKTGEELEIVRVIHQSMLWPPKS